MSSNDVILSVRGLTKSYRIGRARKHTTLAEALVQRLRSPFRRSESQETFRALKDVSFDVRRGDVVGVLGRNGAGKSTLLKIISRITELTGGEVQLYGTVGSLLEVGTGFHGELTGRENIYLNGAILGMRREEIRRRFDEIVAFAGVEQFLDTPVKHYSSGMCVRLAFAVAAHLDPDILVVDEVLAVGDAAFQERCVGKMKDVAQTGRTVLFVSHNMHSVSVLCNRGLYLTRGEVTYHGDVGGAVDEYLKSHSAGPVVSPEEQSRSGTGEYRITQLATTKPSFSCAEPKEVRFRVERLGQRIDRTFLQIRVLDRLGTELLRCDSRLVGVWLPGDDLVEGTVRITTPWLQPGTYRLDASVLDMYRHHWDVDVLQNACTLTVSALLPFQYTAPHALDNCRVLSGFEVRLVS
jgi:lipopolysaccharide transport system ATP-binding protein